jgi:DNA-nicking Smr family endonuclease
LSEVRDVATDRVPAQWSDSSIPLMKKSKPPDKPQHDFKNKPFQALKGIVPSTAVPIKKSTAPPVRKKIHCSDEDDMSLFLRAAEGTKKFDKGPHAFYDAAERKSPEKTSVRAPEDNRIFLEAMQSIGATFRDTLPERESEEAERQSPTSRMRQVKRGTIRISRELDLHGFLKDEALMQLERFVTAACDGGQQAVLVITGKGINSPEGPVLKGVVAEWLRNKGRALVAEFSPAPRALGGSGAFVVFLKKRSGKSRD